LGKPVFLVAKDFVALIHIAVERKPRTLENTVLQKMLVMNEKLKKLMCIFFGVAKPSISGYKGSKTWY